jgi:hypothetical protein
MFSPRIPRLRNATILALAVLVWSGAALAYFVCPHMAGCEHGMPASSHSNAGPKTAAAETMPCCPVKPEISMECEASVMECCVLHHRESDVSAILFASDQPKPKQLAAVLPAVLTAPSLIAQAHVPGLAVDLLYLKPVTQKKTDLRI